MNIQPEKKRKIKKYVLSFIIPCLFLLLIACEDKIDEWEPKSENQVITEYVASNPDQFSEFYGILETTGIKNLLRVRGPFTLLLPTNSAMEEFYTAKKVSSYSELDSNYLKNLVYNHLFSVEISSGSIGFGALPEKNALGDFITSEFSGADIILNKKAKIIKRDILTSNGYVHHIDKVIELVTDNVFDILASTPGYSIFLQGLEQTKINDTLTTITFPYGDLLVRAYFTILAVPDTLFNRYGINNITDLINTYSTGDDITNPNNGFYQYMEYHCLSETYYLSDFEGIKVYPVFSFRSYINIDVRTEYKINEDSTGAYTSFYLELSNIPAKNGAIHTVNTLLPRIEAKPAPVIFETTDFFDLKRLPCYGQYYERFYDGENTFEGIKWNADYLMYYFKEGQNIQNDDALATMGHFWIELTTPKIMKGKYRMSSFWFGGGTETSSFAWYLDGVSLDAITLFSDGVWGGSPVEIADVEFTDTKEHTIKIVTIVPGAIWWDRLEFTPIE
ncbi:MAG: fasciclin domain-containing protein [Bacteroidales bacterium]|nr:fasciclin domain-containing protein [Bacteroidales bacterium]